MMSDDESSAMAKASSAEAVIAELENEITRLRAEVARLEAARLKPETVAVIQAHLSHAAPMLRSAAAALDDLDRCYPPEEV